ncbi:lipoate-protein ligase B [Nitzschia inconspicua]|uniref:Lipoate-protein ligase B n=1 Tax=Nitzschia inconspicua TaxID=303405 RepID=A0A9K3LYK2_9STRA|nr:lipoate-protein ligase B [Nitzschia inconspicua]
MTSDLEHKHGYCHSASIRRGEAPTTTSENVHQIVTAFSLSSFPGVVKKCPVQIRSNSDHTLKNTSSSASTSCEAVTTTAALKEKKAVSFVETVSVRRTLSRDCYTKEERLAYWFTEKDFKRMKMSSMALVAKMNSGSSSSSSTTRYCTRGLEKYTQVQCRHRLKSRYDSIFAVLDEQDKLLYDEEGFPLDDDRISKVYSTKTSSSILWAHLLQVIVPLLWLLLYFSWSLTWTPTTATQLLTTTLSSSSAAAATTAAAFVSSRKLQYNNNGHQRFKISKTTTTTTKNSIRITPTPTNINNNNDNVMARNMISKQQLGSFEPLDTSRILQPSDRKVVLLDFTKPLSLSSSSSSSSLSSSNEDDRFVDFQEAWDFQKELVEQHIRRLELGNSYSFLNVDNDYNDTDDDENDDQHPQQQQQQQHSSNTVSGCDTILLLQHHPVYTLGTASDEKYVLSHPNNNNNHQSNDGGTTTIDVPVVRMDRGGEVTYHGPGQLTVYLILDLRNYKQDIHWYMRALEEAILVALNEHCNLMYPAQRQDNVTGVWINDHKVAAVGIKCKKWITLHGLAVNVEETSLPQFDGIVPCGLQGRKVGCINQFLTTQTETQAPPMTVPQFAQIMKQALEQVFQIELVEIDMCN